MIGARLTAQGVRPMIAFFYSLAPCALGHLYRESSIEYQVLPATKAASIKEPVTSIPQPLTRILESSEPGISTSYPSALLTESTTTRKAGGLDFPALMGGEIQKHVCALIVAVVIRLRRIWKQPIK
jgi:hypothetical protein